MKCKYANVLLAGAGFSHGFGLPLAGELKDLVFHSIPDRVKRALQARVSLDASIDKIITELDALSDLGDEGARHLLRIIRGLITEQFYECFHSMPHDFVELAGKFRYLDDLFPAIITLNWDSLFEQLVSRSRHASEIVMFSQASAAERPLLHLHGCMNWFLATERLLENADQELISFLHIIREPEDGKKGPVLYGLADPFVGEADLSPDQLWELRSLMLKMTESCIAIPSHRKSLSELRLNELWASAAMLLERADNLIVIGYSLPDDDDHMRVLLRHALTKRSAGRCRTRILVVDPNASRLRKRYRRLAGNEVKIVPIEKTFAKLTRTELELNLLEPPTNE